MSISSMNLNVANDIYGVKEATGKKKPTAEASVQPREEAPTLTPSASDTVTLSTKDDASATTTSADGSTPPAKAPFPVVPVAIGGGAGALVGTSLGWFAEDPAKLTVQKDGDTKLKTKGDKITSNSLTHVTDTDAKIDYKIDGYDTDAKFGSITTKAGSANGQIHFNYDESNKTWKGKSPANHSVEIVGDTVKLTIPAATVTTNATVTAATVTPAPASADITHQFKLKNEALEGVGDEAIDYLNKNTSIKTELEVIAKEFKGKTLKGLTDLVETTSGGIFGKELGWKTAAGAGILAVLGAAAGWFFGRK